MIQLPTVTGIAIKCLAVNKSLASDKVSSIDYIAAIVDPSCMFCDSQIRCPVESTPGNFADDYSCH